jgi:hypothetical protein
MVGGPIRTTFEGGGGETPARRGAALPRCALVTMRAAQYVCVCVWLSVCAYVRVRGRREAAFLRSALVTVTQCARRRIIAAYVRVRGRREAAFSHIALVTVRAAQCVCPYVRVRCVHMCACDSVRLSVCAYVRVR